MKDIEYFDGLPESIKSLLRTAPVNFQARHARELLKTLPEERVMQILQNEINLYMRGFKPIKDR